MPNRNVRKARSRNDSQRWCRAARKDRSAIVAGNLPRRLNGRALHQKMTPFGGRATLVPAGLLARGSKRHALAFPSFPSGVRRAFAIRLQLRGQPGHHLCTNTKHPVPLLHPRWEPALAAV